MKLGAVRADRTAVRANNLRRRDLLVAVAAVAVVTAWVGFEVGGPEVTTAVSDLGAVLGAAIAAWCCWRASCRQPDERSAWRWMAVASATWAVGEALWTWFEVVAGDEVPFPSIADAAYLAAVPMALVGLLRFARRREKGHLLRTVLDGALVSGSLLFVAWSLVIGDIWRNDGSAPLAHAVNLAYPVTDVVLAAVALLVLVWGRATRSQPLKLLAAALVLMGLTDSVFLYLTSDGSYSSTNVITSGWLAAYLLIALAARSSGATATVEDLEPVEPVSALLLPYVPLAVALLVGVPRLVDGRGLGSMLGTIAVVLVAVTLARQTIMVFDNRRLAIRLHELVHALHRREAELARIAHHDPLTGLPNRLAFVDQLTRTHLHAATRPGVLYIDLDGFKQVNDRFGHGTGDSLLVRAADRIVECVGDPSMVARLGGDEFVALVESGNEEAALVAERIVLAFRRPFLVDGESIDVGASVGVASAVPGGDAEEAVRRADAAMYVAKRSGKSRAVAYPV